MDWCFLHRLWLRTDFFNAVIYVILVSFYPYLSPITERNWAFRFLFSFRETQPLL